MIILIGIILIVMLLLDMAQTLDIQNHAHMYEINPILGRHPPNWKIYLYFAAWILIVAASTIAADLDQRGLVIVPDLGPVPYLYAWLAGMLGGSVVQAWALNNNHRQGLRLNWKGTRDASRSS